MCRPLIADGPVARASRWIASSSAVGTGPGTDVTRRASARCIRAGTLDNKEGDVEWHLNQYTRTGRKKDYL